MWVSFWLIYFFLSCRTYLLLTNWQLRQWSWDKIVTEFIWIKPIPTPTYTFLPAVWWSVNNAPNCLVLFRNQPNLWQNLFENEYHEIFNMAHTLAGENELYFCLHYVYNGTVLLFFKNIYLGRNNICIFIA